MLGLFSVVCPHSTEIGKLYFSSVTKQDPATTQPLSSNHQIVLIAPLPLPSSLSQVSTPRRLLITINRWSSYSAAFSLESQVPGYLSICIIKSPGWDSLTHPAISDCREHGSALDTLCLGPIHHWFFRDKILSEMRSSCRCTSQTI
ncbi:hypothetical protein TNCV_3843981 [Trichonephila clavipes]|nr:hypothetical protein TNCV_3843981 [Trichonephila clavipes]